jgi:glycosyltransferase involved in cell wall biosynthesis
VRTAYNETKLFVAPLFTGAGLQNKLLEAMSMQVPCVASSIPNASLKATENKHLLIANNEYEFVEKIIQLLNDLQFIIELFTAKLFDSYESSSSIS